MGRKPIYTKLAELKDYKYRNIVIETLHKRLNDGLLVRAKKSSVSKRLLEMLEKSVNRYRNKVIIAAQVIEELICMSKEIVKGGKEAKRLKLSDYEYNFYTVPIARASAN